jgi:hypothetical protein
MRIRWSATRSARRRLCGPGKGKVEPTGDAALEYGKMIRQCQHRLDHMQIVDPGGIKGSEAGGEQIGLLLIVPLNHHAVATLNAGVQQVGQPLGRAQLGAGQPKRPPSGQPLGTIEGKPVQGFDDMVACHAVDGQPADQAT